MIAALPLREGASVGGYLYFPPGRYYLGAPSTNPYPRIVIPSNVTLVFEQGAVLVPMHLNLSARNPLDEDARVVLEIAGEIEAGLFQIFDPNLQPRSDSPQEDEVLAGKVVFTGPCVRQVYPEWWGTLHDDNWNARNRRALQAAIEAAHTDRLRPLRDAAGALLTGPDGVQWRAEPTIPIVATYTYNIDRGLVVGRTPGLPPATHPLGRVNPAPFVLKGAREVGSSARTIEAGVPFRGTMLDLREVSSFQIEDVALQGTNRADHCVRVEPGAAGGVGEFKRCTFQELRDAPNSTLVIVTTGAEASSPAALEPFHVAFTACRLTPIQLGLGTPQAGRENVPVEYAEGVGALLLDYSDRCTVELRTCHLQGHADPMIRARRGRFTANECAFHSNRRIHERNVPAGRPGESARIGEWRQFWNATSGTDIFLEEPPPQPGRPSVPASFTMRECESQSFQFLSTWQDRAAGSGGGVSACVLINLHHNAVPSGKIGGPLPAYMHLGEIAATGADPYVIPPQYLRPSICWFGPASWGCHLIMMGCCFKSQYGDGAWPLGTVELGCVRLGPSPRGAIYHLANHVLVQTGYAVPTVDGSRVVEPANFIVTDPLITAPRLVRAPVLGPATVTRVRP